MFSDLALAVLHIAGEAGEIAQRTREGLHRELKPDGSVVTNADREVEVFTAERLKELLPQASFLGEEFGLRGPEGPLKWVVDPVDGTSNFAFGSPMWGVTIALLEQGEPILGAIVLPDLQEAYLAERGRGVARNAQPLPLIPPGPVQDHELVSVNERTLRRFALEELPGRVRSTGAFVVDATYVATQRFRGMYASGEKIWDIGASVLFGRELGAQVATLDGTPLSCAALAHGERQEQPWMIFPAGATPILPAKPA